MHDCKHILNYTERNVNNYVNDAMNVDAHKMQTWAHVHAVCSYTAWCVHTSHWLKADLICLFTFIPSMHMCLRPWVLFSSFSPSTSCSTSPSSFSCFSPWRTATPWTWTTCATSLTGPSSPWTIACPTHFLPLRNGIVERYWSALHTDTRSLWEQVGRTTLWRALLPRKSPSWISLSLLPFGHHRAMGRDQHDHPTRACPQVPSARQHPRHSSAHRRGVHGGRQQHVACRGACPNQPGCGRCSTKPGGSAREDLSQITYCAHGPETSMRTRFTTRARKTRVLTNATWVSTSEYPSDTSDEWVKIWVKRPASTATWQTAMSYLPSSFSPHWTLSEAPKCQGNVQSCRTKTTKLSVGFDARAERAQPTSLRGRLTSRCAQFSKESLSNQDQNMLLPKPFKGSEKSTLLFFSRPSSNRSETEGPASKFTEEFDLDLWQLLLTSACAAIAPPSSFSPGIIVNLISRHDTWKVMSSTVLFIFLQIFTSEDDHMPLGTTLACPAFESPWVYSSAPTCL